MQQWEYKRCLVTSDEELEKLGKEGWELAAVVDDGERLQSFFKRPLPETTTEWVDSKQIPVVYRTGLQEGRSEATREVCNAVLQILVGSGAGYDNAVKLLKEKYEPFAIECDSMKYWAKG